MKKGLRITLWVSIILLLLTGFVITLVNNKKSATTEIQKETTPLPFTVIASSVKERQIVSEESFRGTIEPKSVVTIYSEADGKITSTGIEKGKSVSKGQQLAVIDATIRLATNQINSISIEKAKQDYELAKKNNDRYQALLKENNASLVEAENAEQQFKAAQIQLQSLQQQLAISSKQVQQTVISSPVAGIIIDKKVFAGDFVQPGTVLGSIADLNSVIVKIHVPETMITRLKVGDEASIKVDVLPNQVFSGRIKTIIPVANEAKAFPIEIEIKNNGNRQLMGGMSTSVSFRQQANNTAILIPRTALFVENEKHFVWVIDTAKKPEKRPVTIGIYVGTEVAVNSGLKQGELIVTSGQNNIEPGKVLKNYSIEN